MTPVADEERPAAGLRLLPHTFLVQRAPNPLLSSRSPTFPSLHLAVQFKLDLSGMSMGEGAACVGRKCGSSVWTNAAFEAGWAQGRGSCVCRAKERGAGAGVRTLLPLGKRIAHAYSFSIALGPPLIGGRSYAFWRSSSHSDIHLPVEWMETTSDTSVSVLWIVRAGS